MAYRVWIMKCYHLLSRNISSGRVVNNPDPHMHMNISACSCNSRHRGPSTDLEHSESGHSFIPVQFSLQSTHPSPVIAWHLLHGTFRGTSAVAKWHKGLSLPPPIYPVWIRTPPLFPWCYFKEENTHRR